LPYAIETVNISKTFNQVKGYRDIVLHPFRKKRIIALKDINIQVNKGELFCLLGPNGAGKTTLIKILASLILPDKGKAYINGYDVVKDGKHAKKLIGYIVNDERSFYWRLTGRQNLNFFAILNNLPSSKAQRRINEVIDLTGLRGVADKMFKDYSTGMKQRLAIARGLITDPQILLMDEPTKSLDPLTAQNLRKFIKKKLVGKDKKTVFLATHNLAEAEELCDRIAIINHGKIKACGTLAEIRALLGIRKRYFIELKNITDSLVNKLKDLPSVDKVLCKQFDPSLNNQLKLEITIDENGDISKVIEYIISSGGRVLSCCPHKPPLIEIFSQILKR